MATFEQALDKAAEIVFRLEHQTYLTRQEAPAETLREKARELVHRADGARIVLHEMLLLAGKIGTDSEAETGLWLMRWALTTHRATQAEFDAWELLRDNGLRPGKRGAPCAHDIRPRSPDDESP